MSLIKGRALIYLVVARNLEVAGTVAWLQAICWRRFFSVVKYPPDRTTAPR